MRSQGAVGDRRFAICGLMVLAGIGVTIGVGVLHHDAPSEVVVVTLYGIAAALITFPPAYLVTKWFEDQEWGRPDHDLKKVVEASLADTESGTQCDDI